MERGRAPGAHCQTGAAGLVTSSQEATEETEPEELPGGKLRGIEANALRAKLLHPCYAGITAQPAAGN